MFDKIVVASEISKDELEVIKRLKGLKKLGASKCLLLQCIEPHETTTKISSFIEEVFKSMLEKEKDMLLDQGYEVETRVVSGIMKEEIDSIAQEEGYSLIVAGTSEHSMLGQVFFGGAAREVIHRASKPVLLLKVPEESDSAYAEAVEFDITRHVLIPTDFSDNSDKAFEYVKEMVENGIRKVTIVNVQDIPSISKDIASRLEKASDKGMEASEVLTEAQLKLLSEADAERLREMKRQLEEKGADDVDVELLYGSPSAEIMKLVDERNVSLVVMGSQGRGFISEIYLGSVSHNIARHSSASVMLIPANR